MSADFAPSEEDLEVILRDIWSSFVSEEEELYRAWEPLATALHASVEFRGDVHGAVVVGCSPDAGREMARRMLRLPGGVEVEDRDVADALGELANTIGGSVKGMLPGKNALTLPRYMPEQRAADTQQVEPTRIQFVWLGESLSAEVWACESTGTADV